MISEKEARLYAMMPEYKYQLNKTKEFIKKALSQVENPYLACSFGKDSSVLLHLVLQEMPRIPVIFVTRMETHLVDNYQEVIYEWGDINLIQVNFNHDTLQFIDKSVIRTAMNEVKYNYDSYFIGLRAEESNGRRITLKKDGMIYKMADGLTRIAPLAFWSTRAIAAYCVFNDLPTLNKYKEVGFEARTTAGISSKTPHESLAHIRQHNMDAFNQILKLMPDAKYFI
jgi:3'-phosphoadenosine 5'-phosphosulfate sulfotransferase (PAPS reductase)/FAD synthetase